MVPQRSDGLAIRFAIFHFVRAGNIESVERKPVLLQHSECDGGRIPTAGYRQIPNDPEWSDDNRKISDQSERRNRSQCAWRFDIRWRSILQSRSGSHRQPSTAYVLRSLGV